MVIIDYPSPNYFSSGALPIKAIVLHGTAGGAAGALQELTNSKPNNPDARVSSNYLISTGGKIYRLVPWWTGRRAWANGLINNPDRSIAWLMMCQRNGINPNLCTLSIEHEAASADMIARRSMPAAQLASSLELIRKLLKDTGLLRANQQTILGHYQIDGATRQNCPGVISIPEYISQLQQAG
jgi:N-acetyl-anhydromuramyl-L-alanine amidase AmpD